MNNLLSFLERAFLTTVALSFALSLANNEIPYLLTISLLGLAAVFFLNAFKPQKIEQTGSEQLDFNDLLGMSIVPKVLWIASAVALIGITFYQLGMEKGYSRTLGSGSLSIIIGTFVLLFLKIREAKHIDKSLPILFRAIPVAVLAVYLYLNLK
ncbi:hypothetical protein [Reichenbachiella sp.]